MLKVGVVGTGAMGKHHARVYSELDCELVGVADVDIVKAKDVGMKYGCEYFGSHRELIKKVDAVSITVPTYLHKQVAVDFFKNGVHCLVEKPIASNLKDSKEMVKTADENNVKLMVGHIERFNPAVTRLKEIIDEGMLGSIMIISSRRVGPSVPRIKDIGIIIDSATHDIDVTRYLTGKEPIDVYSKFGSFKHEKEDHAITVLDFEDTVASVEVNWFTPTKVRNLVVTGTKGIANLDYISQDLIIHELNQDIRPRIKNEEPLMLELKHFLDCIENDKEPLISGSDGMKTLEIALKASRKNKSTGNYTQVLGSK